MDYLYTANSDFSTLLEQVIYEVRNKSSNLTPRILIKAGTYKFDSKFFINFDSYTMNGIFLYGESSSTYGENLTEFTSTQFETIEFNYGNNIGIYNIDINVSTQNYPQQTSSKYVINSKYGGDVELNGCNITVQNASNSVNGGGTSSNHLSVFNTDRSTWSSSFNVYINNCTFNIENRLQFIDVFQFTGQASSSSTNINYYCSNNKFYSNMTTNFLIYSNFGLPDSESNDANIYFKDNYIDISCNINVGGDGRSYRKKLYLLNNRFTRNFTYSDVKYLYASNNIFDEDITVYSTGKSDVFEFMNNIVKGQAEFSDNSYSSGYRSIIIGNSFNGGLINSDSSGSSFTNTKCQYNIL